MGAFSNLFSHLFGDPAGASGQPVIPPFSAGGTVPDFESTVSPPTKGVLSTGGFGGLLEKLQDPRNQLLLSVGASLLSDSGPSAKPISLSEAIGHATQTGLATAQLQRKNTLTEKQLELDGLLKEAQLAQAEQKLNEGGDTENFKLPSGEVVSAQKGTPEYASYTQAGLPKAGAVDPEADTKLDFAAQKEKANEAYRDKTLGLAKRNAQALEGYRDATLALQQENIDLRRQANADKAAKINKPTDVQRAAAGFATRMQETGDIANREEATATKYLASKITGGEVGSTFANMIANPSTQKYANAASNWIRANLRKESGAVIAEDEMRKEFQTYFPVVGDSDEVIKQKRELRRTTEQNLQLQAGPLGKQIEDTPPPPPDNPPHPSLAKVGDVIEMGGHRYRRLNEGDYSLKSTWEQLD